MSTFESYFEKGLCKYIDFHDINFIYIADWTQPSAAASHVAI